MGVTFHPGGWGKYPEKGCFVRGFFRGFAPTSSAVFAVGFAVGVGFSLAISCLELEKKFGFIGLTYRAEIVAKIAVNRRKIRRKSSQICPGFPVLPPTPWGVSAPKSAPKKWFFPGLALGFTPTNKTAFYSRK